MTLPLIITARAHADIQRNAVWWAANHSVQEAENWRDVVYDQLASIVAMPESYALCPENPHFADELREKNVGLGRGGYRAVFTIRDHQLYVLCVRSSSERPLRHGDLKD
jgi:plasmid stabilization system protein ParE